MKKSDFALLLGKDIGNWEIVNVGYEQAIKTIDLLLREFQWKGIPFGRDYKDYTGNVKKIKILDEFAFSYYEDNLLVNTIKQYIENCNGLKLEQIEKIIKTPNLIATTEIQSDWLCILQTIGSFNEKAYKQQFLEEFKKQLAIYYKRKNKNEILSIAKLFNDIINEF